jgi:CheY-like chemotaxis protein
MTVLYVDDDFEDGEIFQEAVNTIDSSINCLIVSSGMEALQTISQECPDYIFLDYHMPLMDGIDVLRQIKFHPCFKKTRIVMYSTIMDDFTMQECKKLGVHGCLEKSTEFIVLCNVLKETLDLN